MSGKGWPRPDARRYAAGRGRYTDDIALPRMLHAAFLRSPYAHARIVSVETDVASKMPGVRAVFTGADIARVCRPWTTVLTAFPAHVSAPQPPLAVSEACWQGEAVAAVVAATRAEAEDAAEAIAVEWEELPAVADPAAALETGAPLVNTVLATNLAFEHRIAYGDIEEAFAGAAAAVTHRFHFERQTGVTLEPRTLIASYDAVLGELAVHHSHQTPFQMREIFAAQLGLPLEKVRVSAPDVGGAFGLKLHAYADEMAVVTLSRLTGRPVKFTADRLEAFGADVHAREAVIEGHLALDAEGMIRGFDVEVLSGFGAYSAYPRSSIGEALHALQMTGVPYSVPSFKGRVRGAFQNKAPTGALRAVGQPLATVVTEQLIDLAAAKLGLDAAEVRRRNYRRDPDQPVRSEAGVLIDRLSMAPCHAALLERMDYAALRRTQAEMRGRGVYRGIGLASFVEVTGAGSMLYGPSNVRVSADEACRLTLEPSGAVRCETSVTDQGQGIRAGIAQVVAAELGLGPERVTIASGDTATSPYGGGAFASRGLALGGEAALQAARTLRGQLLAIAGALLQAKPETLALADGHVVNAAGLKQMSLTALAETALFRPHTIPLAPLPGIEAVHRFTVRDAPYIPANGIEGAHVEVDIETGVVRVLEMWVAEDCGTIVDAQQVDEQIRGGVVQGIGAALYEGCTYSAEGQLQNATMADYLVPMASEMPDIHIAHVTTPARATVLGAKGVGEAGTVGAAAAIWTAVNDALAPLGARVCRQPITPEHVLDAIAAARAAAGPS